MLFKENVCSSEDNLRNLWVCKVAGTQLSLGWKQQRFTFISTSHVQELLPCFFCPVPHDKAFQALHLNFVGSFFIHLKWGVLSQALRLSVELRHRCVLSYMMRGCSGGLCSLFSGSIVSIFHSCSHAIPSVVPVILLWTYPGFANYHFQLRVPEMNSFSRCGNKKDFCL